jgi:hypothetical protein
MFLVQALMHMLKYKEQLRNIPPAQGIPTEIEPTHVALTTRLWTYLTKVSVIKVY